MTVSTDITINADPAAIWAVITDIDGSPNTISGIDAIEVLDRPASGFVGLRWRETRTLFGKEAEEVMWITEAEEPVYYQARAESHGCIYVSELRITQDGEKSILQMSHQTSAQTLLAKVVSVPMSLLFRGTMRKLLEQDLADIKQAVEAA